MSARFQMILTMSLFGTIALFVKFIDMPSAEIALFRAAIALVTVGVMKLFSGKRLSFKEVRGDLPVLLLSGTMIGLNWVLFSRPITTRRYPWRRYAIISRPWW